MIARGPDRAREPGRDADLRTRALVLWAEDERDGHYTYFVSHPDPTDIAELWRGLATAVGKGVLVVPVPRPVLYAAMRVATALSRVFGFTNQLDAKQARRNFGRHRKDCEIVVEHND